MNNTNLEIDYTAKTITYTGLEATYFTVIENEEKLVAAYNELKGMMA